MSQHISVSGDIKLLPQQTLERRRGREKERRREGRRREREGGREREREIESLHTPILLHDNRIISYVTDQPSDRHTDLRVEMRNLENKRQ